MIINTGGCQKTHMKHGHHGHQSTDEVRKKTKIDAMPQKKD